MPCHSWPSRKVANKGMSQAFLLVDNLLFPLWIYKGRDHHLLLCHKLLCRDLERDRTKRSCKLLEKSLKNTWFCSSDACKLWKIAIFFRLRSNTTVRMVEVSLSRRQIGWHWFETSRCFPPMNSKIASGSSIIGSSSVGWTAKDFRYCVIGSGSTKNSNSSDSDAVPRNLASRVFQVVAEKNISLISPRIRNLFWNFKKKISAFPDCF